MVQETVDVSHSKRYNIKSYKRRKRGKAPQQKKRRLSKHKPTYRDWDAYGRFK